MGTLAGALLWVSLGAIPVAEIGGGNSMTLPAQRHLVRVVHADGSASLYLAIQEGKVGARGLQLFRSDDEGAHWARSAAIQGDATHPDTADLIQVGQDVAMVFSYEGPSLAGSSRHDVYFQWWRYSASTRSLSPDQPLKVFDSTSDSTAYYRGEIAADSRGRLWVQAFRMNADGTHAAAIAVSEDGGQTFRAQPDLAVQARRGGGRLLWLGHGLIFLWHGHDLSGPARFRLRSDAAAADSWGPVQTAFSEGIYHGAALSAVTATSGGGMHLVYKAQNDQRLWYRFFDGAAFGPRQLVDDSSWWSTQANATLAGDDLYVFYNHLVSAETSYEVRLRKVSGGVMEAPVLLDGSQTFKGYPAALERAPASMAAAPCAFGYAEDASAWGQAQLVLAPLQGGGLPPAPPAEVLFSDDFARSAWSLGPQWAQDRGLWLTNGQVAGSNLDGADLAHVSSVACRDCSVEASVVGFGVPEAALVLRAQGARPADHYDVALLGSGVVQIRRVAGEVVTVLGQAAAGVPPWDWATLRLTAVGSGPVTLTASIDGMVKVSVVDTSPGALGQAGYAGMSTTHAGVGFDRFRITSE